MGVGLYLKNYTDKSGKQAIQLKAKHGGLRYVKSIGISAKPSDWDNRAYRIKGSIPIVADKLSKIRDNMYSSWELYEAGSYSWEELTRRLAAGHTSQDVLSFLEDVFSQGRTSATILSYKAVLRTFKSAIGVHAVTFNHLNYSNITQAVNTWKSRGLSPSSIESYIKHIGSIHNEAFRRGLLDSPFIKHKQWRQKKRVNIIQTATPEAFREAIDKIENLRDFQALALWLLQFTMRGLYTSDISTMHLHKRQNEGDSEANRYVLHRRSKTGEVMDILYSCEPTEGLILSLQNSIHITHKDRPEILPDRSNPLQLFVYDYNDSRVHKNIYDNLAKRSSRLFMPFKTARKTFESYALMLSVPAEVRHKLTGHTPKSIKEKHYQNWQWEALSSKIDTAHLEVLKAFEAESLFKELLDKVSQVSNEVNASELMSIHLTKLESTVNSL